MIYIAICDDSAECRAELEGYCRDFFCGVLRKYDVKHFHPGKHF